MLQIYGLFFPVYVDESFVLGKETKILNDVDWFCKATEEITS
jgi:hypothetical protein